MNTGPNTAIGMNALTLNTTGNYSGPFGQLSLLEIIEMEIRLLKPPTTRTSILTESYEIHCSGFFLDLVYKEFLKKGFCIPAHVEGIQSDAPQSFTFQLPTTGRLKFIPDLDSGYTITK